MTLLLIDLFLFEDSGKRKNIVVNDMHCEENPTYYYSARDIFDLFKSKAESNRDVQELLKYLTSPAVAQLSKFYKTTKLITSFSQLKLSTNSTENPAKLAECFLLSLPISNQLAISFHLIFVVLKPKCE